MPRIGQRNNKPRRQTALRRPYRPVRPRYRGSGAYTLETGPFARVGAWVGKTLGEAAGAGGPYGPLLGRVGEWVGRRAFHYPARLFGSGAYTKRQMVPMALGGSRMAPEIPTFAKKGDYVEISFREYIGDIISAPVTGETRIYRYAITPGESATFPWLSSIVQPSFQQYKFEGCVFQFQSRSADALNSTNTALGSVVAGIDYDASASNYTTRAEIENLQWSSSCKPSCDMDIPVECASKYTALGGGLLYVLNQAGTPSNVDMKTFLLGKLFILTTGCQGSNVNLGSLYVTYKIRLYKPMIQKPLSNANVVKIYRNGVSNAAPGGTSNITTSQTCDTIGCTFDTLGVKFNVQRLIPGAKYWILMQYVGVSSSNVYLNVPGFTLTGLQAYTGPFMDSAGTLDNAPSLKFPTVNTGTTDTQVGCLMELVVADNVAQTGASINFGSTGHGFPGSSKLLFMMVQRNGLATDYIGYFNGW